MFIKTFTSFISFVTVRASKIHNKYAIIKGTNNKSILKKYIV